MKAVICTKYGPPEVLQIQDVPKPTPKNNEILVRIIASAVNSGDVRVRGLAVQGFLKVIMRLVLGFTKPRKPILGVVFSGVVEAVGDKVSRFNVGDKVFGMTGFKFGTHAEYIAINQYSNVLVMPENATYEEAAAIVFGGHTAIYFLNKMKIAEKRNPIILIIGATGSVGTSAIQIAKYFGANITAVCSSSGKDFVESLGVEDIILYDREDFLNQPNQFDFVFDAVGKTTKKQCRKLLRDGGVYKTVGGLETASESKEQLELSKLLFEEGLLKAVIDKTYTLKEIVEAHRYVDSGRKKGNVVLKITD
ncbi:NAD(P)-dependent alcohol dehydrogenase [Sphingobacterium cavernae]|uniref:NAD(P)-dependent alcohol dehydrogenase n=1 Tax=Sphingobacterium cavernae TaxID=2592657 RepID=UPI00122FFFAE|nr:NAD(P)-dependent alcohol dehydrogenase [Sphingobacterium cavernae]